MNISKSLIALAVLGAAVSAPAGATSWDFYALAQPGGERSLGTSYTFTQGTQSITASVWSVNPTSSTLYAKKDGTGERGIGLTPESDNEISYPLGVELHLSSGTFTSLQVGSVQGASSFGESYQVQVSTDGITWTTLTEGIGGGVGPAHNEINVTGLTGYSYVILDTPFANNTNDPPYGHTNANNDIVLDSVVTTSVPEPAMLSLMGLGLAALGFARRRKA